MNRISLSGIILAALAVIAVFAPWVNALGIIKVSVTQGSDAIFLIVLAVITAVLYWRYPLKLVTPIIGFITAVFFVFEVVNVVNIVNTPVDNEIFGNSSLMTLAWGTYMAGIVAAALIVLSVVTVIERRQHRRLIVTG
jgi:hypothetical protein